VTAPDPQISIPLSRPPRPFLRWAGSKRKLIPTLRGKLPQHFDRYYEPFAGSACLFFALPTGQRAVLGDINEELINAYQQIQCNVENVIALLRRLRRTKTQYYCLRSRDPGRLDQASRAARFIFLNRLSFNGIYRTNKAGAFNVPYGGHKCGPLPTPEELRTCATHLRTTELRCLSFERTLRDCKQGDFVYLDPPYRIKARRVFNEYSHHLFDDDQLDLLRTTMLDMDRKGVNFLVSYGLSKEALFLAKGFETSHATVQRHIAGFASKRKRARELLISNCF
jgi:DNA adenine methylase